MANIKHLRPLQQRSLTVASLPLLLSSFERGYKIFFLNFLRNMTTSSCAGSEVSCKSWGTCRLPLTAALCPLSSTEHTRGGAGGICESCYTHGAEVAKLCYMTKCGFGLLEKRLTWFFTLKIDSWTSSETPCLSLITTWPYLISSKRSSRNILLHSDHHQKGQNTKKR